MLYDKTVAVRAATLQATGY